MRFTFWRRSAPVLEREPEAVRATYDERAAVAEAVKLIQRHIDKEARNRSVRELPIRELCPMQKEALVRDLAKLLR